MVKYLIIKTKRKGEKEEIDKWFLKPKSFILEEKKLKGGKNNKDGKRKN